MALFVFRIMLGDFPLLFPIQLYSDFRDSGQNLTFHVVAHTNVERVSGLQGHFADVETVLEMAKASSLRITTLINEFASNSIGLLSKDDVISIGGLAENGLFNDKRESHKGV